MCSQPFNSSDLGGYDDLADRRGPDIREQVRGCVATRHSFPAALPLPPRCHVRHLGRCAPVVYAVPSLPCVADLACAPHLGSIREHNRWLREREASYKVDLRGDGANSIQMDEGKSACAIS